MNRLKSLTIIGAGKVGTTLGALFQQNNCFKIQQIYARNTVHGLKASQYIKNVDIVHNAQKLNPADVFLITTSDNHIAAIGQELITRNLITPGTIVFHCSGFYTCDILSKIRTLGGYVASAHPAKTFADIQQSSDTFSGTICALEGDAIACELLGNCFAAIGATVYKIKAEDKPLWHLAQVFASNYMTGIYAIAETLLKSFLSSAQIQSVLLPLMHNTLRNIQREDAACALTGPIARGDHETVASHIQILKTLDPVLENIYKLLGKQLLELAKLKTNSYSLNAIETILNESA